jgi:hypothetical protein
MPYFCGVRGLHRADHDGARCGQGRQAAVGPVSLTPAPTLPIIAKPRRRDSRRRAPECEL